MVAMWTEADALRLDGKKNVAGCYLLRGRRLPGAGSQRLVYAIYVTPLRTRLPPNRNRHFLHFEFCLFPNPSMVDYSVLHRKRYVARARPALKIPRRPWANINKRSAHDLHIDVCSCAGTPSSGMILTNFYRCLLSPCPCPCPMSSSRGTSALIAPVGMPR